MSDLALARNFYLARMLPGEAELVLESWAKTIKKNTNSTHNKSQTHRAKQYEVTSFLSTDCELRTETCSKTVYNLGPLSCLMYWPTLLWSQTVRGEAHGLV